MRLLTLAFTLAVATPAVAETRRIAFWPDAVPAAIQYQVDGAYVLAAVRSLGRYHRVQGSPGFRAATEWLGGQLTPPRPSAAEVEDPPAHGVVGHRSRPRALGPPVAVPDRQPVRVHDFTAHGRCAAPEARARSSPDRRPCPRQDGAGELRCRVGDARGQRRGGGRDRAHRAP